MPPHQARHLSQLLDADSVALAAPARVEILVAGSEKDLPRLRRALSGLPVFFPGDATWSRIDAWLDVAAEAGERFGFADLLIGAIAAENSASIWSLDRDFARMAKLGLVELYSP